MNHFVALAALTTACNAVAAHGVADDEVSVGGLAQVAIVDRVSGVELIPHFYRGEYWVAGKPGATYSIAIWNRLGERLLAVASVDGVNVVSGATAAWDQTGYVFGANQGYEITGWRKSDSEVAAFTFTESPNSYAERTGRPANVGVIGVALFRERQPEPVYAPPVMDEARATPVPAPSPAAAAPRSQAPASAAGSAERRDSPTAPSPAASAPSPSRAAASGSTQPLTRSYAPPLQASAPKLGTGHGERQFSYVNHTEFSRLQPEPNEVIRIRYDSFDNLVAMGVIARPRSASPTTNPFPGSPAQQYVPDPPGTNAGAR
jgi:cell division septation protein DedD